MNASLVERAEIWRLLALGFAWPDPSSFRFAFAAAAGAGLHAFEQLAALADDRIGDEYLRLFSTNVAVSPYETMWVKLDKGARLGQIAALYDLFGVRILPGNELPDHVGTELEFQALLCVKAALGPTPEDAAVAQAARKVFTEEHLGRWIPAFCERLAERTRHPFYAALAGLLEATLAEELAANGWSATDTADAPLPPEDPNLECPQSYEV